MNWPNRLQNILKTKYPIVQAPMFGVSTPEMTAATSNFGALGSLALGDLDVEKSLQLIHQVNKLTVKPFAANIFVHQIPELEDDLKFQFNKVKEGLQEFLNENNLVVELPELDSLKINSYHEQLEVVVVAGCKIISFTFGNLDQNSFNFFKENGVISIGTCTSVHEAIELENSGVDIICVQGWEAGGHRGSFDDKNIPKIGGFSLLSQVRDSVSCPLIYAGGIYDAKTMIAAKKLGADGFQIGSLFLSATESALQDFEKESLKSINENQLVVTKAFSGRYARGVKNLFIQEIEKRRLILPYPYQNKLTAELRKVAKLNKNPDFVNLWIGQSLNCQDNSSTEVILRKLVESFEQFED